MSVVQTPSMAIETRHLYKRFGDVTALDDINLQIAGGVCRDYGRFWFG